MVVVEHPPLAGIVNDEPTGGYINYSKTLEELLLGSLEATLGPNTILGMVTGILTTTQRGGRVQEPMLSGRVQELKRGGRFP